MAKKTMKCLAHGAPPAKYCIKDCFQEDWLLYVDDDDRAALHPLDEESYSGNRLEVSSLLWFEPLCEDSMSQRDSSEIQMLFPLPHGYREIKGACRPLDIKAEASNNGDPSLVEIPHGYISTSSTIKQGIDRERISIPRCSTDTSPSVSQDSSPVSPRMESDSTSGVRLGT